MFLFLVICREIPVDLSRARCLSPEIQDFSGETINVGISRDGMWRLGARAQDVSPMYLAMLLRAEDKRFYAHPGVDPFALLRAAGQFLAHGRIVSGGSTLTMQVARLLHPHRHTFLGKLRDIEVALRLEAQLSKQQILALYLTLAPFGGNIEGVRAASLIYFGHTPATLSVQEAALLVALPQRPEARRPDRHPAAAERAVQRVLARLDEAPAEWRAGVPHLLPRLAPHFAAHLREEAARGAVRTTLDANLQRQMQAFALRERGTAGAGAEMAALVVRNCDRAVLGYLGGSDFFARFGMVDMVRAVRSPGSVLKPFIYGMAFDDGLIRPDTLIEDTKMRIADYAPQDFDKVFRGTVTAAEALQQSYNLPAVTLLDFLGPGRFAAALRGAGARLVIPGNGQATLPLALGGVGMNLWDLATLYAGLADGGDVRKLRIRLGDSQGPSTALLTHQAAADIFAILRDAPRPAGVSGAARGGIAYKTGTSFGFRDAWAFGFSRAYTVGVWVGHADGSPQPGAFARATAAPLLFQLFDLLPEAAGEDVAAGLTGCGACPRAPSLRRLQPRDAHFLQAAFPRIVYPPAGVMLELPPGGALSLEAAGGVPPYRWAVNGVPLPQVLADQGAMWQPDGPGFVHVTLTDSLLHTVQEVVRLR